ncbi:MAG: nucleoid-associated protein, YbaB/EbfC family [Deltaproteobacteria bacterium RIFCSPLOWO2_12_FULL_40_28]|nr:MAG: nucleoid-associated protein, YbaB/EbfC family [Deltaproteobacteria bacterium RIFCSPHIGHO2_02_FULL_40_28]OGQ19939.1 MAG: nucleoid-associated protein, YbaB/EbfC family [Deltaproteobacteria bacterium RIFCSPHIGHO2_12_FULL_40_32]OGQ39698.1 MAG: nucleoid-associated protein, YbaB/EbfC family [Deltaproteobacteria bacterium RIFCSPLOWO2_02_FULL_40_36]OGQ53011.1 MAG: nucleoid-associated protein, YbaB/EbfC family [Deltaproteobacteria bacterium RIFCSPLOWO2_12_FULL_40_28]
MKMNQILKQAGELQKKLQEKQAELEKRSFSAQAGGGMVTATVNGKSELVALKIEPEVINKDEADMLQDLVIAAVNEAARQAAEASQDQMGSLMGNMGLKIPGLF